MVALAARRYAWEMATMVATRLMDLILMVPMPTPIRATIIPATLESIPHLVGDGVGAAGITVGVAAIGASHSNL